MQQTLRKILPLFVLFLLSIVNYSTVSANESPTSYIGGFHMWYVHDGEKQQTTVQSGARREVEKILHKIDHLAGLSSYQLPTKYLLIKFDHPMVLSTFSPVKYPIQSVIVTIPQHKAELARLLIRNTQGSWVEYHTTQSLSIFIQQTTPSSDKDEGVVC
jgi:hypothetical protein